MLRPQLRPRVRPQQRPRLALVLHLQQRAGLVRGRAEAGGGHEAGLGGPAGDATDRVSVRAAAQAGGGQGGGQGGHAAEEELTGNAYMENV